MDVKTNFMSDSVIETHMVILLSSKWRVINWCSGLSEGEGTEWSLLCVMDKYWRLPEKTYFNLDRDFRM